MAGEEADEIGVRLRKLLKQIRNSLITKIR